MFLIMLVKIILSISVIGAVEEPGFYDLKKYKYLNDLIEDLNFVGVYPWLAVLEQFDSDNLVKSILLFNLNDKSTYEFSRVISKFKIIFC